MREGIFSGNRLYSVFYSSYILLLVYFYVFRILISAYFFSIYFFILKSSQTAEI